MGLGILGIPLPVLPTTPFLLLALWCFARSSERWERWLLTNKLFGKYLDDYHRGRGIPKRVKVYILMLMWVSIGASAHFAVKIPWVKIVMFAIAVAVTVHILRIKNKKHEAEDNNINPDGR